MGDWHKLAKSLLGIEEDDQCFPSDDEWLTAIAYIVVKAAKWGHRANYDIFEIPDYVRMWKGLQSAKQWDRMIGGITLVGSMINIVRLFSGEKPPKRGTIQWQVFRHACAQSEATAFQQDM